jgi:hypothetical protein
MKDVYITSTLKAEWNRAFNPRLCDELEARAIRCHLPQRDTDQSGDEMTKYEQNIIGIDNSEVLLAVGENESINWGLEVGYAFGIGKLLVLIVLEDHFIPVMSRGMYARVLRVSDLNDIASYIEELVAAIRQAGTKGQP